MLSLDACFRLQALLYLTLGLSGLLWPKEAFNENNYKAAVVKQYGQSDFFNYLFQLMNVWQLQLAVLCGYAATFEYRHDKEKVARALAIGYAYFMFKTGREWFETRGNQFLNQNGLYVSLAINGFFGLYMWYFASPSLQSFCSSFTGKKSASGSFDDDEDDEDFTVDDDDLDEDDDEELSEESSSDESAPAPARKKASPAKKSPAKRSPAKRSPAKRSPAKKSPAKRAAPVRSTRASPSRSKSPGRSR